MTAILFVSLLAGAWMAGAVVAAHAAHYFLTIVESSATATPGGFTWARRPFRAWIRDGIDWPDDPFVDYFAKGIYLAYLIGLWAGPAVLFGRWAAGDSGWTTAIAAAAFWLLFPLGLLSSLASASRWTPFWPGLLGALARRPMRALAFYLLSAPVLAVLFFTLDLVLVRTSAASAVWAVALSPVAAVCFFVYARLLGRLGLVVSFAMPAHEPAAPKPRPRRSRRRKPLHAYDPATRPFVPKDLPNDDPPARAQPADLPTVSTPYDGPITGYGVDYSGRVPPEEAPPPPVWVHPDEDATPVPVAPPPEVSDERQRVAAELAKPSERELSLFVRDRPAEPANPYGPEAVTFLLDPKTIGPWLTLALGLIALAVLQRALDALRPV